MAAVPIVLAILSALSSAKGARDQRRLLSQLAWRGGEQMNWGRIQKTLGQLFGGPGFLQNQPDINTPGGLMAMAFINALQRPGALAPISYIRAQEQANQMQQAASNRGVGMLSQMGSSFNTPLAQSVWNSGAMAGNRARQEALRDVIAAQQQQSNWSRVFGTQGLANLLNMAIDFRKAKGALLQGGAGLQANSPNQWSMLGQGLGMAAGYTANNLGGGEDTGGGGAETGSTTSGGETTQEDAQSGWYGGNPGPYQGGYVYPNWWGSVPSPYGANSPYSGTNLGVSSGYYPGPYASGYQFSFGR